MLITLYTSRVILEVLGVAEYGIWSLIFSLTSTLSFITTSLAASTQRFLNFELAKNNIEKVREVFKTAFYLYSIFSAIVFLLFETAGLWFLNSKLDIPVHLHTQANIVYQGAILSFIIIFLRLPFDALIIANERFGIFAIMGIAEAVLKLLMVYCLKAFPSIPHLTLLSILTVVLYIVFAVVYITYSYRSFPNYMNYGIPRNRKLTHSMLSFSGWNTFGGFALMTSTQGLEILVNTFFGVVVNAAMGIAYQILRAFTQLVTNFQTAFQPQIVKRFAANQYHEFLSLIQTSSKISFLLAFIVGCPLIFNIDFILALWLKDVPPLTSVFSIYVIICVMVDSIGAPFWMAIHATGKIRNYQITISLTLLSTLIISYLLLKLGMPADVIFKTKLSIDTVCLCLKIYFLNKLVNISIGVILRTIIAPLMAIAALGMAIMASIRLFWGLSPMAYLLMGSIIFVLIMLPASFFGCLNKTQRREVTAMIAHRLHHRRKTA